MSLPLLVFRVDAGKVPGLSLGHFYRCLALKREFNNFFECRFLMTGHRDGIAIAHSAGLDVKVLLPDSSDEVVMSCCESAAVVVFDVPVPSGLLIDRLASRGIATVVIDDTGNKCLSPTVLVNGSLGEEQRCYPQDTSPRHWLLGPQYCVLGEEFDAVPARSIINNPSSLTIFMGGSDPAGMTLKAVNALLSDNCDFFLKVILGSGFGDTSAIENVLTEYRGPYTVVKSPASVAQLLAKSDLAILAGGRAAYEAAALGLPAILLPSIEHEEEAACAFDKAGIHRCLHVAWRLAPETLNSELNRVVVELMGKPIMLEQMSTRGREVLDGGGRKRVTDMIITELV
jgi:UDP-2,4-diacetamido-2,4,6-trideoxy-beta-L-altropyranose hydrolase